MLSPVPFIILNYALIFAYRPLAIVFYDAPTLDYEAIDSRIALHAIQFGLLSLIFFLLPYFNFPHLRLYRLTSEHSASTTMNLDRLIVMSLVLSLLVLAGLIIYGSALNNVSDRLENQSEYRGYFLFIIIQRFHFVISAIVYYYFFSPGHTKWRFISLAITVTAPILILFAAGRGAFFYILITYGVIFVFKRSIPGSWKNVALLMIAGITFTIINFMLGVFRVIVTSPDWNWSDLIDALDISESEKYIEYLFLMASWDYSVFEVFVRILNNTDEYMLGATNVKYFLAYVPRLLWPDKPLDMGFMPFVTSNYYKDIFDQSGSTFAGTLVGEGYVNFGILGVCLYTLIFSWILYSIYKSACLRQDSRSVILYSLAFPFSQQVIRGGLDVAVNFGLLIALPLFILHAASKTKKQSFTQNQPMVVVSRT